MNRGALAQMKAGTSKFHILHSIFSLLKNKEPVSLMNVQAVISNINLRKFQPLKFLIFKYFVWWNGKYSQSTSASDKILCLSQEEILVHMLKWQTEVATFFMWYHWVFLKEQLICLLWLLRCVYLEDISSDMSEVSLS